MGLIFVFSSIETEIPLVRQFPLRDKGLHFTVYAVLGWLCATASVQTWPELPGAVTGGFAFCVATLWGFSDELHQAFVPGRTAEFYDLVADAAGSFAGSLSRHLWSQRPRSRTRKPPVEHPGQRQPSED